MPEFIVCRNLLIEEYAHVEGESLAEIEAKWHTGLLDPSFELGETVQTGEALIYPVPEDRNAIHPSAPDLNEVKRLREQARILREALERVNHECDSTPNEDPHLSHAYESVTAETVIAVRAAIEATKEGA